MRRDSILTYTPILFFGWLVMLCISLTILPVDASAKSKINKAQVIARLKTTQTRHLQDLTTLEATLKKRLQESTQISLRTLDSTAAAQRIADLGNHLDQIDLKRSEIMARRDFLDQLIFSIDTKWTGQPLQLFLEHQFLDMAVNDLTSQQEGGRAWKFLTYLSVVIREVPEPGEDLLNIVEGYMVYSTILDPKPPTEFISNRDYTSGPITVSAQSIDRGKIGDGAHSSSPLKLNEVSAKIELRLKVPAAPQTEPALEQSTIESMPESRPESRPDSRLTFSPPSLLTVE